MANTYRFDELSETAKEYCLEAHRYTLVEDEWYENTVEEIVHTASLLGIEIDPNTVRFDVDGCQGDGFSFIGTWRRDAMGDVAESWPADTALLNIAETLRDVAENAKATINRRSGWAHRMQVFIPYWDERDDARIEREIEYFCEWAYDVLRGEYDYLTNDETVIDLLDANGFEFDQNGNRDTGWTSVETSVE